MACAICRGYSSWEWLAWELGRLRGRKWIGQTFWRYPNTADASCTKKWSRMKLSSVRKSHTSTHGDNGVQIIVREVCVTDVESPDVAQYAQSLELTELKKICVNNRFTWCATFLGLFNAMIIQAMSREIIDFFTLGQFTHSMKLCTRSWKFYMNDVKVICVEESFCRIRNLTDSTARVLWSSLSDVMWEIFKFNNDAFVAEFIQPMISLIVILFLSDACSACRHSLIFSALISVKVCLLNNARRPFVERCPALFR